MLVEIIVSLFAQTVGFAVSKEYLLTIEEYLIGRRECVPIPQTLLRGFSVPFFYCSRLTYTVVERTGIDNWERRHGGKGE